MEENYNKKEKYFETYCKINEMKSNSQFDYNRFVEAVVKNDNHSIETTKTFELLVEMLSDDKLRFKETLCTDAILYRARVMDISNISKLTVTDNKLNGFNKYESKEPPVRKSIEGRNNIAGASYLYLAKDPYTAVSECKPFRNDFVSIAEFKPKKNLRIFNFCDNEQVDELKDTQESNYYMVSTLVECVMKTFYSSIRNSEIGYRVSQYISDLVRKFGYDGIAYKSFISNGKNYTIFNCAETNIEFVGSEIVKVVAQHIDVISLNSSDKIQNPNNFNLPTCDEITKFKENLVDTIKFMNDDT